MVCGNKMGRKELIKLEYNMIHALHLAGAPGIVKQTMPTGSVLKVLPSELLLLS